MKRHYFNKNIVKLITLTVCGKVMFCDYVERWNIAGIRRFSNQRKL